MSHQPYDVAVLGSGPIGAVSAYLLSQRPELRTCVITQDPVTDITATYLYAGGCIRMGWEDPVKDKATKMTGRFLLKLARAGVDMNLIKDSYVFLNRGTATPSINVAGAKIVNYLAEKTKEHGADYFSSTVVQRLTPSDGGYHIETSTGSYAAKKVLLAFGAANGTFLPGANLELERRQLFVLNVPIDASRERFPHLVAPMAGGVVYVFVKKFADGLRFVLGQEDIVDHSLEPAAEDYYPELIERGLLDTFPFLKGATVERTLWGYDVTNKVPQFYTEDKRLYAVNCGSALRSSLYIGKKAAALFT